MTVISLWGDVVDGTRVVIDVIISEDGDEKMRANLQVRKQKLRRDHIMGGLIFEEIKL